MVKGSVTPSRRTQAIIVVAFLAFQVLDVITTHVGFGQNHPELNQVMAQVVGTHGELAAYAIKGAAIAVLLGILMILQYRRPHVWHAFTLAAGLTALGVASNVYQLMA
jgi:hypothetical protein